MEFRSALIVDDHPLFCDALSMTLRGIAGIETVRTAATLAEALETVGEGPPVDVIVLDLNLPDVNGMDGLVRLKSIAESPVVVVSSMSDDRVVSLALRSGASGFVPKHSQRDVFNTALNEILQGRRYVPKGFVETEEQNDPSGAEAASRLASLTDQQSKILSLICEGKLNKQIAFELAIAEATVKAHVTAIMRKLGVQSRTQAALLVKNSSFANLLHDRP